MTTGKKSLLRLTTTGSVDDGKSTLIGRLLYETKSIYEDQYLSVETVSRKKGLAEIDLALLLDGLSAEREQGITIDVAYRYFETDRRKYIIADTPGHVHYTRNMVTGASTADCAIILIDARKGVLTQSKRHGFVLSLLGIPHLIVAVNKMDLVGYSESAYDDIVEEYRSFSEKLDIRDMAFIPVSALKGDNVVEKSQAMDWYGGYSILGHLENLQVSQTRNLIDFRFPVQIVLRPHQDFRGYAGRIVSGTISPGEKVAVLPSGRMTTVRSIVTHDGKVQEAFAPQSVVLTLDDELDVSRGDMIVRRNNLPQTATAVEAMICWMDEEPLSRRTAYLLKQTTRTVRATVETLDYKIDVNTLHRRPAESLDLNDIGRVELRTTSPLFFDPYRSNRATGSFILIDPLTNRTAAAGMIRGPARTVEDLLPHDDKSDVKGARSPHTVWREWNIPREEREERQGHRAAVVWLTGLSGAGKSTIARALERRLFEMGCRTMLLDGDQVRHGLCSDLGFSDEDRSENIRRVGETASLFFESGHIVLCTFISPFARDRAFVRSLMPLGRFFEVFVRCSLETCQRRDPHGLYRKALAGEIPHFTGLTSPYEEPGEAEIILDTETVDLDGTLDILLARLRGAAILAS